MEIREYLMSLNDQERERILREHFLVQTQGSTSTGQSQSSVSSSTDNQHQFGTNEETQEDLDRYATEYFERQNQNTNIPAQTNNQIPPPPTPPIFPTPPPTPPTFPTPPPTPPAFRTPLPTPP